MGAVVAQLVDRVLPVEDIDLLSVGGDGAGAVAVGGDARPGGEGGSGARAGDLLAVERVADDPDAVHAALAVKGDAVVAFGLAAGIKPRP